MKRCTSGFLDGHLSIFLLAPLSSEAMFYQSEQRKFFVRVTLSDIGLVLILKHWNRYFPVKRHAFEWSWIIERNIKHMKQGFLTSGIADRLKRVLEPLSNTREIKIFSAIFILPVPFSVEPRRWQSYLSILYWQRYPTKHCLTGALHLMTLL